MSVESEENLGGQGPEIGPCSNAEEYAVEFLKQHEGAASPAMIAEEYGCTPGHMQDVLRDSGQTERVDHGEYVLSTQTEATDGATWFEAESEGEATDEAMPEATDEAMFEDGENPGPSGDGGHRSEDRDTEENDGDDGLSSTSETVGAAAAAGGASVLAVDDWETQKWMLVGLAVGAVVYLWWRSRSSDQGGGQEQIDERDQQGVDDGPTFQHPVGGD